FIINYLGYYSQCTMSDIIDYMNIPASTATRITNRLVEKNLVKRTVSDKDRRSVIVSLTDLGKEAYLYHEKVQAIILAVLLKDLSEEELSIVIKVLRKMVKNIEEFRISKSDD
ncbi:MAG: MarR family winged helix-turn-helix transcriptional regulator, partial [Promethearchaeota archaeon]